jgi:iron complex outermembrane recepter protein
MGLQMLKSLLLFGTACSTFMAHTNFAHAQAANSATPSGATIAIQGISKTAQQSAIAKKIPLKSQYAASHISRSEIEAKSPVETAQDILNTEPSIVATAAGPLGVENTITFRAFNDGQFSETFDGIALNDVFSAGVTNEGGSTIGRTNNVLVTSNDFDSVDIYRGINNPAVNSYNSLGGTINYEPKEPSDKFGGEVGTSYGSFNTFLYHMTLNTGNIDGVKQLFSFERGSSDGWFVNNTSSTKNNNLYYAFDAATPNSGKIYGNFIFNQNTANVPFDEANILISENGRNFQPPQSVFRDPARDQNFLTILGTTQNINSFISADLKGFFGTDDFSKTPFSNPADQTTGEFAPFFIPFEDANSGEFKAPDDEAGDGGSTTLIDEDGATDHTFEQYGTVLGLSPSVNIDLPYNDVKIGANYTFGQQHSTENLGFTDPAPVLAGVNDEFNEHDARTLYAIYVQDEIDLLNDAIKITPGVKYLYANTKDFESLSFDDTNAGTHGLSVSDSAHYLSPTLGASYEFLPNTVLYAAYGQNIEFPTIGAFFDNIDDSGNFLETEPVHLEPEHVTDYESGIRYSNPFYGFHGALGFYLEDFTDTFVTETDPVTDLSTLVNGGASRYKGIELQLAEDFGEQHIAQQDVGDITGYFNYAYNAAYYTKTFNFSSIGGNDGPGNATVTKGQPIALVPQDTVKFGLNWNLDGWQSTADANYVTSEFVNDATAGTSTAQKEPAYFTLNLGISKTIPVTHMGIAKAVKFQFNIDNVLNREYDAFAFSDKTAQASAVGPKGTSFISIEEAAPQAFYGSVTLLF